MFQYVFLSCLYSDDFPSPVGIVVSESIQNGEYNFCNATDNAENLLEMGKDCYRGDLFVNICKLTVLFFA